VIAVDKDTGVLIWKSQIDAHPLGTITQSPVIFEDKVFVGVASKPEEGWSRTHPGYIRTFRGSFSALDLKTGQPLWKTYVLPAPTDPNAEGYTGGSVWGNTAVVDAKRRSIYIGTGNNFSIPAAVAQCLQSETTVGGENTCLDPANHIDSILALDLETGKVKWARRLALGMEGGPDTWSIGCPTSYQVPQPPTLPVFCYKPLGVDWDFGGGPNLITTQAGDEPVDVLGAGQKSGVYWALNPENGSILWGRVVGPGGTLGGMEFGSASDGTRIYTAIANNSHFSFAGLPLGPGYSGGAWSALDAASGAILWQVPVPGTDLGNGRQAMGFSAVTTANGIMFASYTAGDLVALDAATGATLWSFNTGGTNASTSAVVKGSVYWGAAYAQRGKSAKKLYAFSLPSASREGD